MENYQNTTPCRNPELPLRTFRTVGCGYEMFSDAWSSAQHVFSVTDWEDSPAEVTP